MTDNHGAGAMPPTVEELSTLVIQLRDLMQQEITILNTHVYDGLAKLTDRKRVIAGLLRERQQVLQENPEALKTAPAAERQKLEDLLTDMKCNGQKNEWAVR